MNEEEIVEAEDTETQQEETTIDEVEDDLDEAEGTEPDATETAEQLQARLAISEDKRKRLFARLQREKNKPAPAKPAPAKKAETPTGLTRDEGILFSKGFEEAEVEHAQKVATLQGVKLTEAIKDPLFTTWKTNRDAEVKKQQAQLGTSKGARTTVKKTIDTPGLSDEEHKEMFKELTG